jgi:hypothetical protein
MDLQDAGASARFLIRDHDGKFPSLFGAVLSDAGTEIVLTGFIALPFACKPATNRHAGTDPYDLIGTYAQVARVVE